MILLASGKKKFVKNYLKFNFKDEDVYTKEKIHRNITLLAASMVIFFIIALVLLVFVIFSSMLNLSFDSGGLGGNDSIGDSGELGSLKGEGTEKTDGSAGVTDKPMIGRGVSPDESSENLGKVMEEEGCENLGDLSDECFYERALETGSRENCKKINDPQLREICTLDMALINPPGI